MCSRMRMSITKSDGTEVSYPNPKNVKILCHKPSGCDEKCMDVQIDGELIMDVNLVSISCDCDVSIPQFFNMFNLPQELWTNEELFAYREQFSKLY